MMETMTLDTADMTQLELWEIPNLNAQSHEPEENDELETLDEYQGEAHEHDESKGEPEFLVQEEKDRYAVENVKLIHHVANKFRNTKLPYDELFSVCTLGFTKALNAFDKGHGTKFSTFAVNCMQNEVKFFLRKEKKFRENTVSMGMVLSQDKNGNDFQLEDILSEAANSKLEVLSIEDKYEVTEDKLAILEAIDQLTLQEQYIMNSRYGLNGFRVKTQKTIAEEIEMSQANVSKIQKNCIDKIKRYVESTYQDERVFV
ncbi:MULTISPECIES: sigma-70 family RNA polymerase sigma factor [unclassified Exiguobacterium]|uniref:sigma-70 family RNA polymerase sigma factor n=1 Tax=unclassified Exiguobacterium TaxID=2644629 RepID=UPI0020352DD6|nr:MULTISPECIES: sigma-70 family RNA polymerase sigma factor [unclassified Exiguobacterium]